METHTSASIEFQDSVLRFAEIRRAGDDPPRLVRLGSCAFDFNLEQDALRGEQRPRRRAAVREALADVFAGSGALDLHVTLHPPLCTSLFLPLPADTPAEDRAGRVQEEIALVMPATTRAVASAELMRAEVLPDGDAVHWFHVLALPGDIADRLDALVDTLSVAQHRYCLSTGSAAAVLQRLARQEAATTPVATPYRLGLGLYETHTELTLCRNQGWHFAASTLMTAPADALYFAVALLHRLAVQSDELAGLFLYGDGRADRLDAALLHEVFGRTPEPLNPLTAVAYDAAGLTDANGFEQYAPCVGAALRDVYP